MSTIEQVLIDKIRQLPAQRLAEVEDFVDFLRTREDERRLTQAAAHPVALDRAARLLCDREAKTGRARVVFPTRLAGDGLEAERGCVETRALGGVQELRALTQSFRPRRRRATGEAGLRRGRCD